ncbi:MAG TPA: rhomboid family intramembrane serine protease [Bacteroidales bacterium]|nr:rhomboid family intramembrane serine protease [Bacteroidales bacterium]HOK75409.1 rhomboid family intramembrane serine protease [Bacteroidales bacterium]HOM40336.1 rhomboid family intramembrane serine protease [Bacteroidales bacterium]HPP92373.1 rhomboid family intramembrane serine protease [Bacteroidales bacterium]HQK71394.1 rhomboid family intramembrane serine protease [Bacteroidales bacterium]
MSLWSDIRSTFRHGTSLTRLIILNIAVFLAISVIGIIGFLLANPEISDYTIRLFSVPSSFKYFILRPWTVITYMFTHKDLLHIAVNMLWLYWFGKIFLDYLDQKKLVAVYLLGGITGALLYVISYNIFPAFSEFAGSSIPLLGASAAVMAVVVAISVYVPDYTVFLFLLGRIKIKYIALVIFILTSIVDFQANSGGKLAHIGGALFGYIYIVYYRKGKDLGKWLNRIIDFFVTFLKPRKKLKVTYKKRVTDDYEYNRIKAERQARINEILDKISKGGYDSLTREEKDFLFRESQKKH